MSMMNLIALAVAFSENFETKILNISRRYSGYYFFKIKKSRILSANFSKIIQKFSDDGS